jgi:putative DNA primase/helicase
MASSTDKRNGRKLNLTTLADAKRLPLKLLRELGLHDLAGRGVGIPYYGTTGEDIAVKQRTALKATDGSYWPTGMRLAAYGQWKLDQANRAGFLLVVEGESDCWALWHHGLPALGLPGANAAKTLVREHVEAVAKVYIHREPDQGGPTFVEGVCARLAFLGFEGEVFELRMPDGVKDPADLHVSDPEQFKARMKDAIQASTPLELPQSVRRADRRQGATPTSEPAEHVWADPLPIPAELLPVVAFHYALLPEALREFVDDVAERMQCPPDFPAVAMMVALAGVVGKKIGIRPKRHDDWLVVPNLWGAVIGRPGIMKTPAIRRPITFLQRLQVEAKKRYELELREYEDKRLVAEAQKKAKKRAIEEASKEKLDPLAVAKEFTIEEPEKPTPRRYIVNDSTVEKLGELLNLNPTGLTVFRDELIGLLRQLDKEGQEGARAFYLESWDGLGTFTYDRIARGTLHIESVTLSMLGGIQPGRLLDYLGAALKGGAGDDGLLQRFQLLVYPDVDKRFRNVDRWPDTSAKMRVWAVFQQLDALDPVVVGAEREEGDNGVPFLHFAPVAQGLFDDWRVKLEETVRSGDEHPALESHLAKYRSLVPSLALLIHLVDGAPGPVSEEATRKAIAWAGYLESHARRIYGIGINSAAVSGKALAKRISKGELKDGFTLRDIYRKHWAGLSEKQAVEQAVDLLLELSWLRARDVNTGGKPKTYYDINPKLLTETASEPSARSAKGGGGRPSGTFGTGPPAHFQAAEADDDSEKDWGEV